MPHIRQQLRDRAKTLVQTALSITNVFTFRVDPYQEDELPAGNITTSQEDIQRSTLDGSVDRQTILTVEITRRAVDGVGDELDDDCTVIENSFAGDATMQRASVALQATDLDVEQGSQDTASVQLTFTADLFGVDDPEQTI